MGTLTLNALCAADYLIIPTDMSVLALEGVGDILGTVDTLRQRLQRTIQVAGIVATRYDKRTTQLNSAIEQSFADLYGADAEGTYDAAAPLDGRVRRGPGVHFFATRIPQTSVVNKAHLAGEPIFDHAPSSPAAIAYQALAREMAPHIGLARFVPAVVQEQVGKAG
jgi:chromosome partitioning protein